jgi:hypothetical protein
MSLPYQPRLIPSSNKDIFPPTNTSIQHPLHTQSFLVTMSGLLNEFESLEGNNNNNGGGGMMGGMDQNQNQQGQGGFDQNQDQNQGQGQGQGFDQNQNQGQGQGQGQGQSGGGGGGMMDGMINNGKYLPLPSPLTPPPSHF